MNHRLTYRGYDVEIDEYGIRYRVTLNGQVLHDAETEDAALDWIDQHRRKKRAEKQP